MVCEAVVEASGQCRVLRVGVPCTCPICRSTLGSVF